MELDGSKLETIGEGHAVPKACLTITPDGKLSLGDCETYEEALEVARWTLAIIALMKRIDEVEQREYLHQIDDLAQAFDRGREYERQQQKKAKEQVDRIADEASMEASKATLPKWGVDRQV